MTRLLAIIALVLFGPELALASLEWPNEPAGSIVHMDCPFTSICPQIDNIYNTSPISSPGGSNQFSPPYVLDVMKAIGSRQGNGQWHVNMPSGGVRDIYVGTVWRYTNVSMPNMNNKLLFIANPSNSFIGMIASGGNPDSCKTLVYYQQEEVNNSHIANIVGMTFPPEGTGWFWPNVSTGTVCSGDAFGKLEVYLHASTTNTSRDGIIRTWWNGAMQTNITNANLGTQAPTTAGGIYTSPGRFRYVGINHTWDNSLGIPIDEEWHNYWDHLYVSMPQCPVNGCGATSGGDTVPGKPAQVTGVTATVF